MAQHLILHGLSSPQRMYLILYIHNRFGVLNATNYGDATLAKLVRVERTHRLFSRLYEETARSLTTWTYVLVRPNA
jgi:predicted RNase H-related nuclease YkuK (DUF458 family)